MLVTACAAQGVGGVRRRAVREAVQKAAEQGKEEEKEKAKRDAGMGFDFMTF